MRDLSLLVLATLMGFACEESEPLGFGRAESDAGAGAGRGGIAAPTDGRGAGAPCRLADILDVEWHTGPSCVYTSDGPWCYWIELNSDSSYKIAVLKASGERICDVGTWRETECGRLAITDCRGGVSEWTWRHDGMRLRVGEISYTRETKGRGSIAAFCGQTCRLH
jgi:hypothetical protein